MLSFFVIGNLKMILRQTMQVHKGIHVIHVLPRTCETQMTGIDFRPQRKILRNGSQDMDKNP